jgi:hypothetical protein
MYTMLSKKTAPGNSQKTILNIESIVFSVVTSCSLVDRFKHARGRQLQGHNFSPEDAGTTSKSQSQHHV